MPYPDNQRNESGENSRMFNPNKYVGLVKYWRNVRVMDHPNTIRMSSLWNLEDVTSYRGPCSVSWRFLSIYFEFAATKSTSWRICNAGVPRTKISSSIEQASHCDQDHNDDGSQNSSESPTGYASWKQIQCWQYVKVSYRNESFCLLCILCFPAGLPWHCSPYALNSCIVDNEKPDIKVAIQLVLSSTRNYNGSVRHWRARGHEMVMASGGFKHILSLSDPEEDWMLLHLFPCNDRQLEQVSCRATLASQLTVENDSARSTRCNLPH